MPAAEAVTIASFAPGTLHCTERVAALFGVTPETVRNWIRQDKITARQVLGSPRWSVTGEEVQRVYRAAGFSPEAAAAAATADLPTPEEERRRAEAALKKLRRQSAKAKTRRS